VLVVSPSTIAISQTGASGAEALSVSEGGYSGTFTESDTCSPVAGTIATISPGTGSGPSLPQTVTGVAAGTCVVTFTDSHGQTGSSTITVTTSSIIISGRKQ
jgi:hypothetical protein